MGDLVAGLVTPLICGVSHHPQGVVCMRCGEETWEKLQMNNRYNVKAGKLEPGQVNQLGGTPELGGLEAGLRGGSGVKYSVKPVMRITDEKEEKGSSTGENTFGHRDTPHVHCTRQGTCLHTQ